MLYFMTQFTYLSFIPQDPKVIGLTLQFGPKSGGTRITISGQNVDAGTQISVMVGDGLCNVEQ